MATLGELLFYIATQQQDSGVCSVQDASQQWGITSTTIAAVGRLLKPGEDETCQHYAVKTIENICSQGGEWACKFASQDILVGLVAIYNTTKNDNLKATAASSISRLLRSKVSLINALLDKFGVAFLATGMTSSSSKVQTSAVNMLNLALSAQQVPSVLHGAVAEERQLVGAVINLLDHSLPLLRAKAILAVVLLCRLSTRWLVDCCKQKLLPSVERLLREERDSYTQDAVELLRLEMAQAVDNICQHVAAELETGQEAGMGAGSSMLQQLQVVQHLVSSPFFRVTAITPGLIWHLASFLTHPCKQDLQLNGLSEFRAMLIGVLEQISQQSEVMTQHHQDLVAHLLPALCTVVASTKESGDSRFFCLRMVSDLLATFLLDADLYDPTLPLPAADSSRQQQQQLAQGSPPAASTAALNLALQQHVLPLVPPLLQQEDPMPLYALKLLGGVLEVNPNYVQHVEQLGLAPSFFDFLSLEHPNNNVHNIRLCRQLVSAGSMSGKDLHRRAVADKVTAVLVYAHQNNVEPFLEPVLDLSQAIIQKDMATNSSKGELLGSFLQHLPVFMDLCTHADSPVAIAASVCLSQLVTAYPGETGCWLLSGDGAAVLAAALQGLHLEGTNQRPPAIMQKHLLSAVKRALEATGPSLTATAELKELAAALQKLHVSGELDVRAIAGNVRAQLSELLM